MNNFWYSVRSGFIRLFQKLPLNFHYAVGRVFEWVAKNIIKYRRDVIVTNLARSFPDKKYHEIEAIKDQTYRHMGEVFAEAMWFGGCLNNISRLKKHKMIEVPNEGVAEVHKAYKKSPGIMLMNSHFGNWELIASIFDYIDSLNEEQIAKLKSVTYVVYKRLENKFWNRFIGNNRLSNLTPDFPGYVETDDVLRLALRNKDKKNIYVFLTDQYPYGNSARYEVKSFMNQYTLTMAGGVALAQKLGMAVFEMCMVRKERGRYCVEFRKICDDASKMPTDEIVNTYYAMLEERIKNEPGSYLWSHKRWK